MRSPGKAQTPTAVGHTVDLNTFSIAAHDPQTGAFGVAVSTARPVVGVLVPFVSARGAIATQARVNTDLGRHGLSLLAAGLSLPRVLHSLLEEDPESQRRQIHGVSATDSFLFTGEECVEWAGHARGQGYTVAGNMLTGRGVIQAMAGAYERSVANGYAFSDRLVRALEAAQAAGGDKRGKQSAALRIVSPQPRMTHNLRVDDDADPVAELRRIHDLVADAARTIEEEYGTEGARLFNNIRV